MNLRMLKSIYMSNRSRLSFLAKILKSKTLGKQTVLLSRTACLGNDVKKILFTDGNIDFNFQKSRVDHILSEPNLKISTSDLSKVIKDDEIFNVVTRQNYNFFSIPKPDYIFFDSYSELTDQKFSHVQKKYSFFCNFSDIVRSPFFASNFKSEGLLDLTNLSKLYEDLFDSLEAKYGNVPMVFLHFPYTLETREKMVDRAKTIRQVVDQLQTKRKNLFSISLSADSSEVKRISDMPYHYQPDTYHAFVREISSKGVLNV